jgi:hypothetical protein
VTIVLPQAVCLEPPEAAAGQMAAQIVLNRTMLIGLLTTALAQMAGGTIGSYPKALAAVTAAVNNYTPEAKATLNEYAELIDATWAPNALLASQAAGAALGAAGALQRIVGGNIPNAQAAAEGYAQQLANQVTAYAQALAAQAEAKAQADANTAQLNSEHYAQAVGQDVAAYAGVLVENEATARVAADQQLAHAITTDVTAAESYARSLVEQLSAVVTQDVSALQSDYNELERYTVNEIAATQDYAREVAQEAETNAITYEDQSTTAALQPVWAGTAESMNTVTETLKVETPEAGSKAQLLSTDVPATPALALAGLAAAVKTLATTTTECAQPYCRTKNTLGKDLKTLLSLIEGGALLAFLAAAIATPTGTAEATVDPIEAVIDLGGDIITSLVGVL